MEFHKKLQELRKQKGWTQEELASRLYVSRTAVSKWELGRGYPNIESLKALAKLFSITLDALLSNDELLSVAEATTRQTKRNFRDLIFGLLDISLALLLFLPFFGERNGENIQSAPLLSLADVQPYLKTAYLIAVFGTVLTGVATLALQAWNFTAWLQIKTPLSLSLGGFATVLFIASSQPYAAVFALALSVIKSLCLIKCS